MKRRYVLTALGIGLQAGVAGCLQQDSPATDRQNGEKLEQREKACVEIDSGETLQYQYYKFNNQIDIIRQGPESTKDDKTKRDFIAINSIEELNKSVNLDDFETENENHGEADDFIDSTDFSSQTLLIWHKRLATGEVFEISGIKQEENMIHLYTCSYMESELEFQADKFYNVFVRVNTGGEIERAEWIHNESGSSESYEWESD